MIKLKPDKFIRAVARKGISYLELVELSGVSKATIHRIKSSKDPRYNRTSARNIGKLAKALGVDVTEISTI